ncbi:unnamed protein product [Symbiodinium sp. KB8]|nr:unnamed protein product [Symbiodinium sp. KB8]
MSSSNSAGAPVTSPLGSLVSENELVHFLKLARPEWSKPRRRGRSDIVRVLAKLKAVGVNDIDTLIRKVEKNTINEELYNKGLMPLSRAALDSIRKQKTFMQALESVDVPNIRQVGVFDPVAQMLPASQNVKALPQQSMTCTFLLSFSIYKISCGLLKATCDLEYRSDTPMCPMRVVGHHWQVLHSAYMIVSLWSKHAQLPDMSDIFAHMQAQGAHAVTGCRKVLKLCMVERLDGSSSGEYEYMDMLQDSGSGNENEEAVVAATTANTGMEATGTTAAIGVPTAKAAPLPKARVIYDRLGQVVREPTGPPPIFLAEGDEDAEEDDESSAPNEDEAEDEEEEHNEDNETGPLPYELEPEYRHVSLAMSQAICEVLRRNGNRRAAFHVLSIPPASWRTTEGFVLQALPLTASTMQHPNILRCSDGPTFEPPRFGTTSSQEPSEMTDAELAEDAEMAGNLNDVGDHHDEPDEGEEAAMAIKIRTTGEVTRTDSLLRYCSETFLCTWSLEISEYLQVTMSAALFYLTSTDHAGYRWSGNLFTHVSMTGNIRKRALRRAIAQQALQNQREASAGQPVDLMFLQETHWKQDYEYVATPVEGKALQYRVIHSAGDDKAGLMCMIRAGIVPDSHIRHQALPPGRLLHIRLMLPTPVDIMNTYQSAWNLNKAAGVGHDTKHKVDTLLRQRRRVWKHLEQWLRGTPHRHGCLILGDLNTPVASEPPISGTGSVDPQKAQQQDQEIFQEMLRSHHCSVLNSWSASGWKARTFIPPGPDERKQGTQIDFFIARGVMDTVMSRKAAPFDAPFVPATRCRHRPLQAMFTLPRIRYHRDPPKHSVQQVRAHLRNPQQAMDMLGQIAVDLDQAREMDDLDQILLRGCELNYDNLGAPTTMQLKAGLQTEKDTQVQFTEAEVSQALGKLAAGKAMPSSSAPAAIWKLASDQVTPLLCKQFSAILVAGATELPVEWSTSELVLLPKPGKSLTSPSQLRPINLLPLQAKVLGAMLATRLQEYAQCFLWEVPQYAYLQRAPARLGPRVRAFRHVQYAALFLKIAFTRA